MKSSSGMQYNFEKKVPIFEKIDEIDVIRSL
jgi:hypothetical protein